MQCSLYRRNCALFCWLGRTFLHLVLSILVVKFKLIVEFSGVVRAPQAPRPRGARADEGPRPYEKFKNKDQLPGFSEIAPTRINTHGSLFGKKLPKKRPGRLISVQHYITEFEEFHEIFS